MIIYLPLRLREKNIWDSKSVNKCQKSVSIYDLGEKIEPGQERGSQWHKCRNRVGIQLIQCMTFLYG